jgi:4-amino-4-deoxy-L-arabinose transferase-like glycosyltransferase
VKKNTVILLIVLIVFAWFLRSYHLQDNFSFGFDQERDAWIVKQILQDKKLTLIGPKAGVGDMFLGPLYYYLLAPFYAIFYGDPYGLRFLNLLVSTLTICLIYKVGEDFFSKKVGFLASFIYVLSFYIIVLDRLAWNPNPLMLTSLLVLLFLKKVIEGKNSFLPTLAFSLGLAFQFHATAVFLLIIVSLSLVLFRVRFNRKIFFLSIAIFCLFLAPLFVFDLRHNFLNIRAIFNFLITPQEAESYNLLIQFFNMIKISVGSYKSIWFNLNSWLVDSLVFTILALFFYHILCNWLKNKIFLSLMLLFLWIVMPIAFFSFYRGHVPDYYLLISFPAFILLCSYYFFILWQKKWLRFWLGCLLAIFTIFNLWQNYNASNSLALKYKKEVVSYILQKSQNRPFRLSYTTSSNLGYGFNYLFSLQKAKISNDRSAPIFTIVIPKNFQKITPEVYFGEIGVIGPKYD